MYNLWQVAGGKVEKGESSLQAVLRETKEETELDINKEDCKFLMNDPAFNCDVYATKIQPSTIVTYRARKIRRMDYDTFCTI